MLRREGGAALPLMMVVALFVAMASGVLVRPPSPVNAHPDAESVQSLPVNVHPDAGAPQSLPVFLMHGVTGSPASTQNLTDWLRRDFPGRVVVNLDVFNGDASWVTLLAQVPAVAEVIRRTASGNSSFDAGYHLVCHSQGAVMCRGIVEEMDDHRIDTFVSLAGPLNGQFGSTGTTVPSRFGNVSASLLYLAFYTPYAQKTLSVANFWRDNQHLNQYFEQSLYLPRINNVINATQRFTDNWLRTKRVALFGSPGDGTIEPWVSSFFGTYGPENKEPFVNMTEQDIYVRDTFGLRTMDERGDLLQFAPENVTHEDWVHNEDVYRRFLLPVLSR